MMLIGTMALWNLTHIPREENTQLNTLSRLALAIDEDLDQMVPIHHLVKLSIKAQYVEMFPIGT